MHVEISSICNLQCSFCPEVVREKKLIELPLFRKIIEQVAPLTEQVAFHLMGDPLVHPKIEELVMICAEFQVRVNLVTNGVLLRGRKAELLLDPVFRQVNFSLHSFPDNFPGADPTDYLERIFEWAERALRVRPDLYVNFRLWNLEHPQGTGAKNREMLERVIERFGPLPGLEVDVRLQKSRLLRGRLYLHFDTEFVWPSLDLPLLGETGTCYGLRSHFGILVNGTVVPCCLDKEGGIPLGNVQEQQLLEILENERSRKILKGFRERRLEESLCQRCQYIERFALAKPGLAQELARNGD